MRSLQQIVKNMKSLGVASCVFRSPGAIVVGAGEAAKIIPGNVFLVTEARPSGQAGGNVDLRGLKFRSQTPEKITSTLKRRWHLFYNAEVEAPARLEFVEKTQRGVRINEEGMQRALTGAAPFEYAPQQEALKKAVLSRLTQSLADRRKAMEAKAAKAAEGAEKK